MTIYADVLFLVNFCINFLVLYLTGKMGKVAIRRWRLFMGAILGALYAVLMFFPRLSFGYSALAKVLFSLFVVAITFHIRGARLYIKTVGIFYLVTFCLGGSVMALFCFTDIGARMGAIVKNGIFYMHIPISLLFISVAVSYGILRALWGMLQNRLSREALLMKVGICWNGKEVWIDGLLDTGNALKEPFSGAPVIIAEYEKLLPILPSSVQEVFCIEKEPKIEKIRDEKTKGRIRMIPFSSLGKEHGMLVGFRPDGAQLLINERLIDAGDVIVGIYTKSLARDKSYSALLPPQLAPH